jgi:hypothetical protein
MWAAMAEEIQELDRLTAEESLDVFGEDKTGANECEGNE